jgi:imidazolonepropionase-like amidohydrolase
MKLDHHQDHDAKRWTIMRENIRRLHEAGVRIGVGTDTGIGIDIGIGIGGVYPGSAALREILSLTRLGFTPRQAIRAATSVSARIMGQQRDHGRIRRGLRADLVLTGGRPDRRIMDVFDVRRVFVGGREVVRE